VAEQKVSVKIRSFVSRNRVALHNWVERDKVRPVVVTSPHPPDECLRRLVKVTTDRKSGWYLDWRTAPLPDPLFHGEVGPSGVRVAPFTEVGRSGGVRTWFDARVDPAPGDGTILTGVVGSPSAQKMAMTKMQLAAFWAAAVVVSFIIGVAIAVSGHFNFWVGMAIVVPVIAVFSLIVSGAYDLGPRLEAAEGSIPGLLQKVNDVLDSTSAFPG
jgi:hypothetical protein